MVGFNTNVRHHGKLFHIQTEDSGIQHAHIFTHLFADGGRIVATKKTSYQSFLGGSNVSENVRRLMQAQHKAMFIALRDGLFDEDEARGAKIVAEQRISLDEVPKVSEAEVDAFERAASGFSSATPSSFVAAQEPLPPPHPSLSKVQGTRAVQLRQKPANKNPQRALFAKGLVSDRSLDEVILSYLARDLSRTGD